MITDIYPNIKEECYLDSFGVYKDGNKVSLDNTVNSGYTRWNGERSFEKLGQVDFLVTKPLVFVGAIPNGNPTLMIDATVSALVDSSIILSVTIDKQEIADREGISREDLQKFDGVGLIWVSYEQTTVDTTCKTVSVVVQEDIFDLTFDYTFN